VGQVRMRDIVVLIPGVGGSVLQHGGRDVWAVSGEALGQFLARSVTGRPGLERLVLHADDPVVADVDDGVVAARVLPRQQLVPGLQSHSGYRAVTTWVRANFTVIEREVTDPRPGNLYEWPYDWRRDLRSSARKLASFVNERLAAWQDFTGETRRVIILAHSMGGLVARYYTEVLGGWTSCRALITFGTPHRGSVRALGVLANGYLGNAGGIADVMRSCTSVHQLLPRYQMLRVGQEWRRPGEMAGIPGIDPAKAADALEFHKEIDAAVARNRAEREYDRFATLAIAGTGRLTPQSASWTGEQLVIDRGSRWHPRRLLGDHRRVPLPPGLDPVLDSGDGSVPYVAAMPPELSEDVGLITTVIEGHSSLQRSAVLDVHLRHRLILTQAEGLADLRGDPVNSDQGLALDVADVYPAGGPVDFSARSVNLPAEPESITAWIRPVSGTGETIPATFQPAGGDWHAEVGGLRPGLYQTAVSAAGGRFVAPTAHAMFEVAGDD
jgi:pimeloyl-ACP methyl ester carboxylesterase